MVTFTVSDYTHSINIYLYAADGSTILSSVPINSLTNTITQGLYIPPTYYGAASIVVTEASRSTSIPVNIVSWFDMLAPYPNAVLINPVGGSATVALAVQGAGVYGTWDSSANTFYLDITYSVPQFNMLNAPGKIVYDTSREAYYKYIEINIPTGYTGPMHLTVTCAALGTVAGDFNIVADVEDYPPLV